MVQETLTNIMNVTHKKIINWDLTHLGGFLWDLVITGNISDRQLNFT